MWKMKMSDCVRSSWLKRRVYIWNKFVRKKNDSFDIKPILNQKFA